MTGERLDLCSVMEAAQRLNVSVDTVRRRIRAGEIDGRRDERGQWWLNIPSQAGVVGDMATQSALDLSVGHCSISEYSSPEERLIACLEEEIAFLRRRLEASDEELKQERERSRLERESILSLVERLRGIST